MLIQELKITLKTDQQICTMIPTHDVSEHELNKDSLSGQVESHV